MRLFRQSGRGVWRDVFEDMARELGGMLSGRTARMVRTPCSIGELIDKITILRIKGERIADVDKLANVRRELALLEALLKEEGLVGAALESMVDELAAVNARLWDVEDALRICERGGDFGPRFVTLARSVYAINDERAALKRAVNSLFGSALVEEKSYA